MGKQTQKLTKRQTQVHHLLTKEFETPKHCATRLGISDKRVYQIITELKKKGQINRHFQAIEKSGGCIQEGKGKQIRLHGQQLHIDLIFKGDSYKKKVGSMVVVDGNTVIVNRDSLDIYSNTYFWGRDIEKVRFDSLRYWNRFIKRLESDLDCVLLKARSQNIRLVKQGEYAEINNELAVESRVTSQKIRLYGDDDGKLWFVCDNSLGLDEAETVHSQTSHRDMGGVVKPLMNTLRNNPNALEDLFSAIRQIVSTQDTQARLNKETAAGLSSVVALLKPPETRIETNGVDRSEKPRYIG